MDGCRDGWREVRWARRWRGGRRRLTASFSRGWMNKQTQGKARGGERGREWGVMRDGERLRNQAVKTAGARKRGRKDEWALNESIMINQEASLPVSSSPSRRRSPTMFSSQDCKNTHSHLLLTFNRRFGRPHHSLCEVIMKHVAMSALWPLRSSCRSAWRSGEWCQVHAGNTRQSTDWLLLPWKFSVRKQWDFRMNPFVWERKVIPREYLV